MRHFFTTAFAFTGGLFIVMMMIALGAHWVFPVYTGLYTLCWLLDRFASQYENNILRHEIRRVRANSATSTD